MCRLKNIYFNIYFVYFASNKQEAKKIQVLNHFLTSLH